MGFPSPAADYVSATLTADNICGLTSNSLVIQTSEGLAVVDRGLMVRQGDILLTTMEGRSYFGKILGQAFITEDGEAIEGEALNDVTVHGVLTHTLNQVKDDKSPVM